MKEQIRKTDDLKPIGVLSHLLDLLTGFLSAVFSVAQIFLWQYKKNLSVTR
jgi:hypothetical protein